MAKWGEGDPRWIVEERADATNVNNWHWTEKNATIWSREKLKELLLAVTVENDEFKCRIKDVSKLEGEASANNRKAKLIFFYEWNITADWDGQYKNTENKTKYAGTLEIPNLSEENDASEVDINVRLDDSKHFKLKEFMRVDGAKEIRKQIETYIRLLKEEFSQGLILPTKEAVNGKAPTAATAKIATELPATSATTTTTTNNTIQPLKIQTKKLHIVEEFKCRAYELYQAFTDINMVRAFTQNSCQTYEAEKGGKFSLFDGNITGSFTELIANEKITMLWRYKQWPTEHYSNVTIEFHEKEDHTQIVLDQTGIPHNFVENTQEGWKRSYFSAMKQTFGFGSRLF